MADGDPLHKRVAFSAWWSDHPLGDLFAMARGRWEGGRWVPAASWSLRDLIAFAASLPNDILTHFDQPRTRRP